MDLQTAGVIRAWNLLGGELRWDALEAAAEIIGFTDIERLVRGLTQIRDHLAKVAEQEAKARRHA